MSNIFDEKRIEYNFTLHAPPEEVYKAWTTAEGVKSFFAPDCRIEWKKYGDYNIWFLPDAPEGSRGAEDEVILSFETNRMFSFSWGFPPSLPKLRANQKTVVLLRFREIDSDKTGFKFLQTGWGSGENWQKGYEYFKKAWGQEVLPRLRYRFDAGPVDWEHPPDVSEYRLAHK